MSARDIIGTFLDEAGVDEPFNVADELLARIAQVPATRAQRGAVPVDCTSFTGDSEAAVLHAVADWLDADERVLIGLWSTGFGGPAEINVQVVTE